MKVMMSPEMTPALASGTTMVKKLRICPAPKSKLASI